MTLSGNQIFQKSFFSKVLACITATNYWLFFDQQSVCGNTGTSEASFALFLNLDLIRTAGVFSGVAWHWH